MRRELFVVAAIIALIGAAPAMATDDDDDEPGEGAESGLLAGIETEIEASGLLQGSNLETEEGEKATWGNVTYEFELEAAIGSSGEFGMLVEAGSGEGADEAFETLSGVNSDAEEDDALRLAEIWYRHAWLSGRAWAVAGKVDMTHYFDGNEVASREEEQFLSGGFTNSLAIEFPDENGLGLALCVRPHELISFRAGVAEADADWEDLQEAIFAIGQVDFHAEIAGNEGTYRVLAWVNTAEHVVFDNFGETDSNNGFGVSVDQELGELLTVFGRYGMQKSAVSRIERAWSAGLEFSGEVFGREDDALGIAFGMATVGSEWAAMYGEPDGDEQHGELYYRFAVNDHFSIWPDLQWVGKPEADPDRDDGWLFGIRAQVEF